MKDLFVKYDIFLLLIFLGLILAGLLYVHKDFGISWDEAIQREHGIVSLDYINEKCGQCISKDNLSDSTLQEYKWRHYGTLFQVGSQIIENQLGYAETSERFYLRHRIQLTYFVLALLAFYLLLKHRFSSRLLAFGGILLLLTTPRILGHQFFNPKDAVFLSAYLISIYTLINLLKKDVDFRHLFLHAICTAIVIDIRIVGVFLIPLSVLGLYLYYRRVNKGFIKQSLIYIVLSSLFIVMFWPLLWSNPIENLISAFTNMSSFNWEGEVLLHGRFLMGNNLPPDYIWNWIFVTTPLLSLGMILIGLLTYCYTVFYTILFKVNQNPTTAASFEHNRSVSDFVLLMASLGPILIVILLKSTLYDGWRQLHFVYPMLLFFLIYCLSRFNLSRYIPIRRIGILLLTLCILIQCKIVFSWHPLQHVYFNGMAKKPWVEHYDLDYWGSGFKHAYEEYTKTLLSSKKIGIVANVYPGWESYLSLSDANKEKLEYQWEPLQQEVYVSNFRYREELEKYLKRKAPYNEALFSIKRDGQLIFGFYKIKNEEKQ